MNVDRLAASAIVRAPAKLNLFFEILAKRGDGYHEIETLMVPISLCDTLVASPRPDHEIRVACRWALPGDGAELSLGELPPEAENLATKAVKLLRARAEIDRGISIDLVKRIPAAAGLGGGSSDAAAALLAANAVWELGWPRERLRELAAELGSDVPFFLVDGPAICRGRGERIEPLAGVGTIDCVIVRPPEGLSTAAVYGQSRVAAEPRRVEPLVEVLLRGDTRSLRGMIHNRLSEAALALSPWVERLRREFENLDCLAAQLCGSGTAYFGICHHARHARRVARRLQARGVGQVFAVSTCN